MGAGEAQDSPGFLRMSETLGKTKDAPLIPDVKSRKRHDSQRHNFGFYITLPLDLERASVETVIRLLFSFFPRYS